MYLLISIFIYKINVQFTQKSFLTNLGWSKKLTGLCEKRHMIPPERTRSRYLCSWHLKCTSIDIFPQKNTQLIRSKLGHTYYINMSILILCVLYAYRYICLNEFKSYIILYFIIKSDYTDQFLGITPSKV